jgi:hypothetical protein
MTALSVVQKQEPEQGIEELSSEEMTELSELENLIEKNLRGFYEVGTALIKIRDSRLYRLTHGTFEEYCLDRWDMAIRTAYQLIGASVVIDNVRNCAQIEPPINEAQARPLTQLETPELQQKAWQKAVETAPNGKVTGDHVHSVVHGMIYPNIEESQGEARPLCEKCRRRKVEKNSKNGLCARCGREEGRKKKIQEAQAEWDRIPIDLEAQQYWSELVEILEKILSGRKICTGKIEHEVVEKVSKFQFVFNGIVDQLFKKSFRDLQGSG